MNNRVLFLLITFLILIPLSGKAVTVSPPIMEIEASPGQTINQTFKVNNEGSENAVYYLYAQKFISADEGGTPRFIKPVAAESDLYSWIKFDNEKLTILAGQTIEVPFTISIPEAAAFGGHYAAIFLSTQPLNSKSSEAQPEKTGILILAKVTGEIVENAEILDFNISSSPIADDIGMFLPGNDTELPMDLDLSINQLYFKLRIRNTGNVHIRPGGSILIKNSKDEVIKTLPVNELGGNILPNSVRAFIPTWNLRNYLLANPDEKLTANLALSYGASKKTLIESLDFYLSGYSYINSWNFYRIEENIGNLDVYINPAIYKDQYDYRLLYGLDSNNLDGRGTMTSSTVEMSLGTDIIENRINFYLADIVPDKKYYYQFAVYGNDDQVIYKSFIYNFIAQQGAKRLTDDEIALQLEQQKPWLNKLYEYINKNQSLVRVALVMMGIICAGLIVIVINLLRRR